MNRSILLALGLVLTATAAHAGLPALKHVQRIDLFAYYNGATKISEGVPADLAYDATGDKLYIAAQRTLAGNGPVGLISIGDPTNTATPAVSVASLANVAGGDRESRVVVFNSNLYWGYGLGQAMATDGAGAYSAGSQTGGALLSGVRKYSLSGVQDTAFGNVDPLDVQTGVLNPVEIRYNQTGGVINVSQSQRTEAMEIDPSTNTLAFLNRGSGFVHRASATTGGIAAAVNFPTSPSSTGWRDLAFDASGAAYFRRDHLVNFSSRTDATNMGANDPALINLENKPFSSYCKIDYVPAGTGYDATLFYNVRSADGSAVLINKVFFTGTNGQPVSATGLGWDQADNSIDGSEPIGGVAQTPWSNQLLTPYHFTKGGKQYLAILLGGGGQKVDIYEVISNSAGTLTANLDLGGWVYDNGSPTLNWQIRDAGGATLDSGTVTPAAGGAISITTAASGKLWLRGKPFCGKETAGAGPGVDLGTIVMPNADIDNDNAVTILDYSVLSDYFDKDSTQSDWSTIGDNGWAPKDADIDNDLAVTILDYSFLSDNFDFTGVD